LIRNRERVEEAANTALVSTVAAGALIALLALAAAPLVGRFFGSERITEVAAVMSGIVFLRSLALVPNALLQRRFSFVRRAVVGPIGMLGFGVAAVAATATGWGVWGLVLGSYVSVAVDVALTWAFVRWRPRPTLASLAMWRSLASFGRHVFAADVLMSFGEKVDAAVIGRFLGTAALGQYRYAWRAAVFPLAAIVNVAGYVLYPVFAAIATDRARLRDAFVRALRWISIVGLPASLMLLPLGEPLAVLALGEPWRPAGRALAAMCGFAGGQMYALLATEVWKAAGRPKLLVRLSAASLVLLVALMLALLPFGVTGMGAALSLSSLVTGGYALVSLRDVLDVPMRALAAEIWPPALAALASAGTLLLLDRTVVRSAAHAAPLGLALVLGEIVGTLLLYGTLLARLRPRRLAELKALGGIVVARVRAPNLPAG
jgi:PST family polysaccharide transporter